VILRVSSGWRRRICTIAAWSPNPAQRRAGSAINHRPQCLKDRKFAIPQDEDDLAEKKRQEELEKEIEVVKKEFEEKMRTKLARRKQKEYEKEGKREEKKAETKDDEKDEKEKEDKLKELEKKKEPAKAVFDGPRVFELHKSFYQMRVQKKRDAEMAKRHRERLRNGAVFPSVPGGTPG